MSEEGKVKCEAISEKLVKALEQLLCKRVTSEEALEIIQEVHDCIALLESRKNEFNQQWDQMLLENRHIQWPAFVWDLIVTPVQN